jgi:type IX secretion system PorP/SprF family membrane protein
MKKLYTLLTVIVCTVSGLKAQQVPQYAQYMLNNYILNPAVSGTEDYYEVKSNNRYQWVGVTDAPRTYVLSVHGPHRKRNMGFGGAVYSDVTGPTSRTGAYLSYAYHVKLTEKLKLSLGLGFGVMQFKIDGSKVTLKEGNDPAMSNGVMSVISPDATFGFQIYTKKFYFGVSMPQLIGNKLKFFDNVSDAQSRLARHLLIMGGYTFNLGDNWTIQPSFLLKYVSPVPMQIDLGLKIGYRDVVWAGSAFRINDALSVMAGFNIGKNIILGYAYDFPMSSLKNYSSGSHEVMIGARFAKIRHNDTPPAESPVETPTKEEK